MLCRAPPAGVRALLRADAWLAADAGAEAVCETLLRGWRDLHHAARSTSARIWLYRLATDVCLEGLERRGLSPEPEDAPDL